ncbi:hypothetical protein [Ruminococcus sp.]|uniref:hypothetical protein n=1 Tax=Ruminococcus sp. TaxID=41978 RepID=UPI00261607A2|nr:hypothetical protein [Ruminococcus sp.]MDD6989450.1 hypothetical protein [Ruminococcus sp.]MDY6202303.1 hypothetical protein [Ruminococcus sp.]
MKNLSKKIVTGIMTLAVCSMATVSAFAATTAIDENDTASSLQQKITYTKTQAEIVPAYTVSIPDTVTLGKESATLSYSLELQDDTSFVPDDKKIIVKISSAGYSGNLRKLAVWDSRNLQEAEYLLYNSDAFANPTYYGIGDEIASWNGSNWGTVTRKIKLKDYYSVGAGTYNGVINYSISLEDE